MAVMLLRAGEGELAEKLWRRWHTDDEEAAGKDPLAALADDWLKELARQTEESHVDGDDAVALRAGRQGRRVFDAVHVEPPRGFEALLADQERRGREGKRVFAMDVGLDKYPDAKSRIAALIRDLDQVRALFA